MESIHGNTKNWQRSVYVRPLVEQLEIQPEQGMAQSFGEAGAAGDDLVTADTDRNVERIWVEGRPGR